LRLAAFMRASASFTRADTMEYSGALLPISQ
jgi:hypothetical protein